MGTGKTGRYLNSHGSKRNISQFALVHSSEGHLRRTSEKNSRLRLIAGGHGQKGIELLDKYGIKYNIVKTYPNGVRVGNIPDHKVKLKRNGINQAWFPKNWTESDMRLAARHVTSLKRNKNAKDGQVMKGIYKGVIVGVINTDGRIATVFPLSDQSKIMPIRKRRRKL